MTPPPNDSRQPTPRRRLATLYAVVVIDLIGFGVVIPILPFYAESYGASATVLGLLLTSYAGMQFLFAPVWGRLSDRYGRRPILLSTIAGTALALTGLGLASALPWIFVARIAGGMFGANISVASAYIADATDEDERTKYMGLLGASFAVGFILGPAIGGVLAPYGYHVPLLLAAGLAAANWVLAFFQLEEPVDVSQGVGKDETTVRSGGRFAWPSSRRARWICLAYFVFVYSVSHLETVFAFLMMDQFGFDARQVALILVLMGIIMAGVQGGAIRPLARRFGERRLWIVGTLILAPCLAIVPFVGTLWILLLPLAAASIGRGLVHPSMLSLVSRASEKEERGLVMGTFQSSASLARVAGPLAAGALYDWRLTAPFLAAAVLMLVVLGFGMALDPAGIGGSPDGPESARRARS
ncbi:MAG: MFS transporter [Thermoanaerobaculia bacterium]|nr:MFS transporter [Thermoanaerobaculia bacterium]